MFSFWWVRVKWKLFKALSKWGDNWSSIKRLIYLILSRFLHSRFLEFPLTGEKSMTAFPRMFAKLSTFILEENLSSAADREREVFEAIIQSLHGITLLLLPPVEISPSRPLISLPSSIMFALSAAVCSAREKTKEPVSPFLGKYESSKGGYLVIQ